MARNCFSRNAAAAVCNAMVLIGRIGYDMQWRRVEEEKTMLVCFVAKTALQVHPTHNTKPNNKMLKLSSQCKFG